MSDAEKIYDSLFKKDIPESLRNRFLKASKELERKYSAEEVERYYRIVDRGKDLEALEYVARIFNKQPLLRDKFKVMVYLAETHPENYNAFFRERGSLAGGYLSMVALTLSSVWKFMKGLVLLRHLR